MSTEEYSQQRSRKINDFIVHYNNNTLNRISDFSYLTGQEAEQILNVLSKNKDKIQVANEIILKTGKNLPMFSLCFNQYYLYDGNISYQNCANIYNKFYKDFNNMELMNELLLLFGYIYIAQRDLNLNLIKKNYKPVNLNYQQFKQLYYVSLILYKHLHNGYRQMNAISFVLTDLYKEYLQITFIAKQKKFFINIIAKLLVLELSRNTYNFSGWFQEKPFLLILDLLISNWNLLQNKYKKILRDKSIEWIYFLKKKKNKYLQLVDIYLNLINKL